MQLFVVVLHAQLELIAGDSHAATMAAALPVSGLSFLCLDTPLVDRYAYRIGEITK
jgi:hypothetical protein